MNVHHSLILQRSASRKCRHELNHYHVHCLPMWPLKIYTRHLKHPISLTQPRIIGHQWSYCKFVTFHQSSQNRLYGVSPGIPISLFTNVFKLIFIIVIDILSIWYSTVRYNAVDYAQDIQNDKKMKKITPIWNVCFNHTMGSKKDSMGHLGTHSD